MIPFQLPSGKTVFLTWEQWDTLTDEDVQDMMADDLGYYIEDPFNVQILNGRAFDVPDTFSEYKVLPEDEIKKLKNDFEDSV
jgi:hypothetical protein